MIIGYTCILKYFKITMRNLFSTTILSLLSIGAFAQTTLTRENNALNMGESVTYKDIQFVEPGHSGANQVWDFTAIQFTEKNPVTSFLPSTAETLEGISNSNLSISDDGYNYFMNSSENTLEELGYVNKTKNMTMVYSNPVLKMKYPFSYGDTYSDEFAGVAFFDKTYRIDFTGDYTATADGYGTLLMPNLILENVMRVKSVKKGIQVNPCGNIKINIVKYSWYAEGYRYPVMVITIVENTPNNSMTPQITKTASVYTPQIIKTVNTVTETNGTTVKPSITGGVSVSLFPNPFSEKINYTYFLKNDMPVSIMLYDITGRHNQLIADKEPQTSGFHSGDIGGLRHALPAGVYYLRFTFGEQVVVQKFVKLEAQ